MDYGFSIKPLPRHLPAKNFPSNTLEVLSVSVKRLGAVALNIHNFFFQFFTSKGTQICVKLHVRLHHRRSRLQHLWEVVNLAPVKTAYRPTEKNEGKKVEVKAVLDFSTCKLPRADDSLSRVEDEKNGGTQQL